MRERHGDLLAIAIREKKGTSVISAGGFSWEDERDYWGGGKKKKKNKKNLQGVKLRKERAKDEGLALCNWENSDCGISSGKVLGRRRKGTEKVQSGRKKPRPI